MRKAETRPRRIDADRVSKGSPGRPGSYANRTVVAFDDETHAQLRSIAIKRHCSFAEVVRLLVEFGLEDVRQLETPRKAPEEKT